MLLRALRRNGLLLPASHYSWRACYIDDRAIPSPWFNWASFDTLANFAALQPPTPLAPAAGAQAASCSPPRSLQRPWPVTGGGDSHIASQWQIASDEAFTRIVDDSSKASDLASHALTKPLDPVSCNLAQWQDRACQNTRRPCRGGKKRA